MLIDAYAGVVLDVDGVVVRDRMPIPGAADAVRAMIQAGATVVYATNNASRSPAEVAALLVKAGLPATADQVVTSSLAAAALLPVGACCFVIGTAALRTALSERGAVITDHPHAADTVVVGMDRGVSWDDLAAATTALRAGARFLSTNGDVTFPSAEGITPGNGATVAFLEAASGRRAEVAGKPNPPLLRTAAALIAEAAGAGPVLMVGDRHETDIAGAAALGWDTALVLTGVTRAADVPGLDPAPTYVLKDLGGLLAAPPPRDPEAVVVRSASDGDLDAIIALWGEADMLAHSHEPRADLARLRAVSPDLLLVAERDGRVIATLMAPSDGRRGWFHRMVVTATARRDGVGRALVREAERRLAGRGIPRVNLLHFTDDEGAAGFWQAMGYTATDRPVVLRTASLSPAQAD